MPGLGPEWAEKKPSQYRERLEKIPDRLIREKKGVYSKIHQVSLKMGQVGVGSEKSDWTMGGVAPRRP